MNISRWQRVKRRVALWGGQYTWPDGYLELDIDAKAGVHRDDPTDVKMEKLNRYGEKEGRREKFYGRIAASGLLGLVTYLFASHQGMEGAWAIGLPFGARYLHCPARLRWVK